MKTWRTHYSPCAIALTLLVVSPLLGGEKGKMVMLPSPDQCYGFRGRLDNSRIKIEREKKARVAFLGGSITEANGWRVFTAEMLPWAYIFDAELKPGEHELVLRTSADKNPKSQGRAARILQFLAN
jgi:hypothetical protein